MNITYRDYEEKDYDDLRGMMFCLYEEDPEGIPIDDVKIKATIGQSRAHPEKLRLIMIRAGEANVGYAIVVFFWSNEYGGDAVVMDELYIRPGYRDRQVATGFFNNQMAAYPNAASLKIESTPSNDAAARLYTRLGFEPSPNNHWILPLRSG